MMVRSWTKEENQLVMRCFYQSDPTRIPKTNDNYLERNGNL